MHQALLMVRTIAVKACLVVMDQDTSKGLYGRICDPGMPFVLSCKVHGRSAVAAYNDIVIAAVYPCRRAVHMHHGCVKKCLEQVILLLPAL